MMCYVWNYTSYKFNAEIICEINKLSHFCVFLFKIMEINNVGREHCWEQKPGLITMGIVPLIKGQCPQKDVCLFFPIWPVTVYSTKFLAKMKWSVCGKSFKV